VKLITERFLKRKSKYQSAAWWLFVVCTVFCIASRRNTRRWLVSGRPPCFLRAGVISIVPRRVPAKASPTDRCKHGLHRTPRDDFNR
jgi:hypothetical protein